MRMTPEEFLVWDLEQPDGRHELVDGIPRPQHPPEDDAPRGMTGASERHDSIVMNLHFALRGRLRGGPCKPYTADSAVRIPNGTIRRPDAAVDCGQREPDSLVLDKPALIVEVLSKSTRFIDQHDKLADYKSLPSLATYVMVFQDTARVVVLRRQPDDSWQEENVIGLASKIDLPDLGFTLPLSDIYADVAIES